MDTQGSGRLVAARYRLLEQLGAGGMGVVWRATDELLHVEVAVKQVGIGEWLPDAERDQRVLRAMREARNAARLREHPHIVTVHDVVVENGVPWIVMEYVPSRTLAEVVGEDGPLTVDQARVVGLALVDALATAHELGIVHRDVKPANVLLSPTGRIALVDFGIAVHEDDAGLTASGVIGTLEYIAPERLRGDAATAAGDLFSLGCTLYQAMEGISPFRREQAYASMAAVLGEPPPPPHRTGPLTELILALLGKDPARRPTSDEVRRSLGAADVSNSQARDVARQLAAPTVTAPVPAPAPTTPLPAEPPAAHPPPVAPTSVAHSPGEPGEPAEPAAPTEPRVPHRPPAPSSPSPTPSPASLPPARLQSPTVPPPDEPQGAPRRRRRRPLVYILSAVGAVIALIVVLSLLPQDGKDGKHKDEGSSGAAQPGGTATSASETSDSASPSGASSEGGAAQPALAPGVAPNGYTVHEFAPAKVAAPAGWQVDFCDSEQGCHLYPGTDKDYGIWIGAPDPPGQRAEQLIRTNATALRNDNPGLKILSQGPGTYRTYSDVAEVRATCACPQGTVTVHELAFGPVGEYTVLITVVALADTSPSADEVFRVATGTLLIANSTGS
ncbi:serine/threonine-protein kinase [Embleya sp. NBC_00896]|uniref:serine/threonine-protein kinase n=1 Tax=Embleya sp. NBC_00896 TaxID=2975961 RepID=UPI00386D4FD2|nr:serine/threonine protein kinase [Embleya sp. NBC_00896]